MQGNSRTCGRLCDGGITPGRVRLAPPGAKEAFQPLTADISQHPGSYLGTMIQAGQIKTPAEGIHYPALRVRRTIDQAGNAGVDDRTDAHQARLQGDVQGGTGQKVMPIAAE